MSVVAVSRNDDYGGDLIHRIGVFASTLVWSFDKCKLSSELILVEWNPPQRRPKLASVLPRCLRESEYCRTIIIEVPPAVHCSLPNPENFCLYEYVGKNVGIARARGEYILATNPDVIFSSELAQYLARGLLSPKCFYRIDRSDVKGTVPFPARVEDQLMYCQEHVTRVYRSYYIERVQESWLCRLLREQRAKLSHAKHALLLFPLDAPHMNAAGDFCLMHRQVWFQLRGYPELDLVGKTYGIDGLILLQATVAGLRQVLLQRPLYLYHQEHSRPERIEPMSDAVREAYHELAKRAFRTPNSGSWGLGDDVLPATAL